MSDAGILSAVFVAVLAAFYLMFLRPIQKDQEKHRQQIRDLRPGDEVLTTGGLLAMVEGVETPSDGPMVLHLRLAEGVVVRAHTSAIAERLRAVALPDDPKTEP